MSPTGLPPPGRWATLIGQHGPTSTWHYSSMDRPETRYAISGDVHIAFQTLGSGPPDLVLVPAWVTHLDFQWEIPGFRSFAQALARSSRVILYDRRGTGLSDPTPVEATIQQHMDDLRVVIDAADAGRAVLFGYSESGSLATAFAASFPDRVEALLLCDPILDGSVVPKELRSRLEDAAQHWGQGHLLSILAPNLVDATDSHGLGGLYERAAASRENARAVVDTALHTDVTPLLTSLAIPTMVLHRREGSIPLTHGESVAKAITGCHFGPLNGAGDLPWLDDFEAIVTEVGEFLTGKGGAPEAHRFLATLLFTDIVKSTAQAAAVGDERWGDMLRSHDSLVRAELARFGGHEMGSWGDSFLATFDGPAPAVHCGCAIRDALHGLGIQVRVGIHTGEVKRHDDTLAGIGVHIGARVVAHARPDEILVSRTVRDLLEGSGIGLADRGAHVLKGVPGRWQLFAVEQ